MSTNIKELIITKILMDEESQEIGYEANDGNEKHEYALILKRDENGKIRHHVTYDYDKECFIVDEYTFNVVDEVSFNKNNGFFSDEYIDDRDDNHRIIAFSDECMNVFLEVLKDRLVSSFINESIEAIMSF